MTTKVKGTLEVKCCSGRDLLVVQKIGKQDPFLQFEYNATTQRIRADNNGGQKPVWNEVITFKIVEDREKLSIQCYDENLRSHAYIGEVIIELKKVLEQHTHDAWFPLTNNHKSIPAGEIYLEFTYYPADGSHKPFDPAKKPTFFAPVPANLPAKPAMVSPNGLKTNTPPPGPSMTNGNMAKPKPNDTPIPLSSTPSPISTANPPNELPMHSPLRLNPQDSPVNQNPTPVTPSVKPATPHDIPISAPQPNYPTPRPIHNQFIVNPAGSSQLTGGPSSFIQPGGTLPIPGQFPSDYSPPLDLLNGPKAPYNPPPSAPPLHESPSYSSSSVQPFPAHNRPPSQQFPSTQSRPHMHQSSSLPQLPAQQSSPLSKPSMQQSSSFSQPSGQQPSPPHPRPPMLHYSPITHSPVQQPSPPLSLAHMQQHSHSLIGAPMQQYSPPLKNGSHRHSPPLPNRPTQNTPPLPSRQNQAPSKNSYSPSSGPHLSRPGSFAEPNVNEYGNVNESQYFPPSMPSWNGVRPIMPEAFSSTGRPEAFPGGHTASPMSNAYMSYPTPFPEPSDFGAAIRAPSFPVMGMPMPDEYVHDNNHFPNYETPYAQSGGYHNPPMFPISMNSDVFLNLHLYSQYSGLYSTPNRRATVFLWDLILVRRCHIAIDLR